MKNNHRLAAIISYICILAMLIGGFAAPISANAMTTAGSDKLITATAGTTNISKAASTKKAKKAAISKTKLTLKESQKKTLKVTGVTGKVTWTSSDKKIATVSKKGLVTAKRAGKATIKATYTKNKKKYTLKCTVTVKIKNEASAKKKILALKSTYKEGTAWGDNSYYYWSAINCHCYGCIAFVGRASDYVFGKNAPVKTHKSFSKIKVGDHVRIGNYHSVLVLSHNSKSITVVEGNYGGTIHWYRKISKSELTSSGFYVETRY